ncbi:MAG: right-handed parallel beta-helix repeat-containing protein, partial [Myxococcota bacterium]|nr:right-handed parallel beta-helix repeat-containing protein [Myxococcota bacterium]
MIADAMTVAAEGTIVAVGKGTFDEPVVVPGGVTLWGACVAETVVASSSPSDTDATITPGGPDAEVRNVRLEGERTGIVVAAPGSLAIEDVVVADAAVRGVLVEDEGVLAARRLVVRDTRPRPADGKYGRGLQAQSAAHVTVESAVLERNRDAAVAAFDASTSVTLADVAIRETRSRDRDGTFGFGMAVAGGAAVQASRVSLDRNRVVAILVVEAGTQATLADVVVRDTESEEAGADGGQGLQVAYGGVATVGRALFERNREGGVVAALEGSSVMLSDAVIRDTRSRERDRTSGVGLHVGQGARAVARRSVFERNRDVGIRAESGGTSLILTDVAVRDTRSQESNRIRGWGLGVGFGAAAEVSRSLFERNRDVAVLAYEAGSTLTLSDVAVRDTQSQETDGMRGSGLMALRGVNAEVTRAVFERNGLAAIAVSAPGTILDLADVVVRDTVPELADACSGFGLWVEDGALLDASRVKVHRNQALGVYVSGAGAVLRCTDVAVLDTQAVEACPDARLGFGLHAIDGGRAELTRGLLAGNVCVAAMAGTSELDAGGTLLMSDVVIRDTTTCGEGSAGVIGARGSVIALAGAVLERNVGVGIVVTGERSVLTAADIVVRDTASDPASGERGRGLVAQDGATATVSRSLFERNREAAITVFDRGTTVSLADLVVRDTLERVCAVDTCAGFGAGTGVASLGGARVDVSRFLVMRSALCGVQLAHGADESGVRHPEGGTMDLHDGEISFNAVCGANVQTAGFDLGRLQDNVLFHDNGTNLDMSDLP